FSFLLLTYTSHPELYTLSYTTLFRSFILLAVTTQALSSVHPVLQTGIFFSSQGQSQNIGIQGLIGDTFNLTSAHNDYNALFGLRSEEHTSELQSRVDIVCRLLLEKKN